MLIFLTTDSVEEAKKIFQSSLSSLPTQPPLTSSFHHLHVGIAIYWPEIGTITWPRTSPNPLRPKQPSLSLEPIK